MQTSDAARGTYCALVRTNSPKPPVGRCLASPPCHEPGHVSVSGCSTRQRGMPRECSFTTRNREHNHSAIEPY
uniref:Uncharacterized protein n=1 Tax=Globodera rostochiensis TaxID=31243 RepID=A0A914I2S4_GLORO